jgi:hypothetical protein
MNRLVHGSGCRRKQRAAQASQQRKKNQFTL